MYNCKYIFVARWRNENGETANEILHMPREQNWLPQKGSNQIQLPGMPYPSHVQQVISKLDAEKGWEFQVILEGYQLDSELRVDHMILHGWQKGE